MFVLDFGLHDFMYVYIVHIQPCEIGSFFPFCNKMLDDVTQGHIVTGDRTWV